MSEEAQSVGKDQAQIDTGDREGNDDDYYVNRFAVTVVIASLPVLLVIILWHSMEAETGSASAAVTDLTGALRRLPTQTWFYVSIATLIGVCLSWRWWQYLDMKEEFDDCENNDDGKRGLISRDWLVVHNLRKRALSLRTRADLLLIAVFGLLFGGIYLILFILPGLEALDAFQAQQVKFEERFSRELQPLVEGRRWIKVEGSQVEKAFERERSAYASIQAEMSLWVATGNWREWQSSIATLNVNENATAGAVSAEAMTGVLVDESGIVVINRYGSERQQRVEAGLRGDTVSQFVISADGRSGAMVGDEGALYVTSEGLDNWDPVQSSLIEGQRITELTINANGRSGVIGTAEGKVYVTSEGLDNWELAESVQIEGEWITSVAISDDGRSGMVVGDEGTVYVTSEGLDNWELADTALVERGWSTMMAISADGNSGVIGGAGGKVYVTSEGLDNWELAQTGLSEGERITDLAISADGNSGVIGSADGKVYVTSGGLENWELADMSLKEGEWITSIAISENGRSAVLVGDEGTLYVTARGVHKFKRGNLVLKEEEQAFAASISADGEIGAIGGYRLLASVTTDDGKSWSPTNLAVNDVRQVSESAVTGNGETAIIVTGRTTVSVTTDFGSEWKRPNLPLRTGEEVRKVALSEDGRKGVLVGDSGTVLLTTDAGATWRVTTLTLERGQLEGVAGEDEDDERVRDIRWFGEEYIDKYRGSAENPTRTEELGGSRQMRSEFRYKGFVVATTRGNYHLLRTYPELDEWRALSPARITMIMNADDVLRNSSISQRISAFILEETRVTSPVEDQQDKENSEGEEWSISDYLDNLTTMRIATSTILFFLVQLLVRLYQYSLRLAAFWESRSDAILLDYSFAEKRSERFDELVGALAPDAYDFKAPPRSRLNLRRSLPG